MIIDPVTATLALLRGDVALTALTVADVDHGIYQADESPSGLGDDQTVEPHVVIQLAPAAPPETLILDTPFVVRCYGPSYVETYALYQAIFALLYGADGMGRGTRRVGRWVLRFASLSGPTNRTEPKGWKVTRAELRTRWHLMEGS